MTDRDAELLKIIDSNKELYKILVDCVHEMGDSSGFMPKSGSDRAWSYRLAIRAIIKWAIDKLPPIKDFDENEKMSMWQRDGWNACIEESRRRLGHED